MSRSLDRALDVLAAAPANDASYEPYGTNDPSKCWRCLGPAGTGASGVCDACRTVLLGDGPIEPAGNGWSSFRSLPNLDVRLAGNRPLPRRTRAFMRRDDDEEWTEVPVNRQGGVDIAVLPPETLTSGRYTFRLEQWDDGEAPRLPNLGFYCGASIRVLDDPPSGS